MENMIFIVQYAAKESIISSTAQVGHGIKLRGQEATPLQFDRKLVQLPLLRLRYVYIPVSNTKINFQPQNSLINSVECGTEIQHAQQCNLSIAVRTSATTLSTAVSVVKNVLYAD